MDIAYIDADARFDLRDTARQIAWFQFQGMLSVPVSLEQAIDARYVIPLPEH